MKTNKKNVKFIALLVAAFFALGIVGIAITQTQTGFAAPANSSIGVIDVRKAMAAHPDAANVETTMKAEIEAAQKEFEDKAKGLSEQEKQRYFGQLQQRVAQKEASLINDVAQKVEAVVEKVAKAKGLSVVVVKDTVIYGGTDITDDVIKAFGKK